MVVPVLAVFTKSEALEIRALAVLEYEGHDYVTAIKNASKYAEENLRTAHLQLESMPYPPRGHVYLQGK